LDSDIRLALVKAQQDLGLAFFEDCLTPEDMIKRMVEEICKRKQRNNPAIFACHG